jgi:hypothetical protein
MRDVLMTAGRARAISVRMRWLWLVVGVLLLSGCNLSGFKGTPSPTPDVPTVEFLSPPNNATVLEGTDLDLDLVGRDPAQGIVKIELLVDGAKINEAVPQDGKAVPVFRVTMNWLAKGVGDHPVSAVAYRADGAASLETVINLKVLPHT